jgi:hypothetical protein
MQEILRPSLRFSLDRFRDTVPGAERPVIEQELALKKYAYLLQKIKRKNEQNPGRRISTPQGNGVESISVRRVVSMEVSGMDGMLLETYFISEYI